MSEIQNLMKHNHESLVRVLREVVEQKKQAEQRHLLQLQEWQREKSEFLQAIELLQAELTQLRKG